jgi:hypothetical protein
LDKTLALVHQVRKGDGIRSFPMSGGGMGTMPLTKLGAVAIGGSIYVFHSGNTLQYTLADDLL